eukprot:gene4186-3024_t
MKEKELWDITIEALETFYATLPHERTISPEETAEQLLKRCGAVAPQERVFARECAASLVRFEPLCDGALKGYCRHCHRHKKSDRFSMLLMAYIMIFRYKELGGQKVRELFYNCTDMGCIAEYVEYLLDIDAVMATAVPLWLQSYDKSFIDSVVLHNLREIRTEARRDVAEWFRVRSEICVVPPHSAEAPRQRGEKETSPLAPGPLHPSAAPHAVSPPKGHTAAQSGFVSPEEEEELRQLVFADGNRLRLPPKEVRDMVHTVPEPRMAPLPQMAPPAPVPPKPLTQPVGFSFHHRPPRENRFHHCEPRDDSPRHDGIPEVHPYVPPRQSAESVRPTNATLLREVRTHLSRREAKMQALREREACPHDATDYERWRDQENLKEERQREMDILQRHLDAVQTEENVRAQKEQQREERAKATRVARERRQQECERRARVLQRQLELQHSNAQYTREQMMEARQAAMDRHVGQKTEIVSAVRSDIARRKAAAREAEEAEKVERAGIIREIQQLRERIKRNHIDYVEANKSVAWERPRTQEVYLDSMSVVELRQELIEVRERMRREAEARRQRIVQEREEDQAKRTQMMALCEAEREKIRKARVAARAAVANSREVVKAAKQASEADHMLALHEKLEAKREQQREELSRMREMERQHLNEVLLRAEDFHGKEQRRWEQEERRHIKRNPAVQEGAYAARRTWLNTVRIDTNLRLYDGSYGNCRSFSAVASGMDRSSKSVYPHRRRLVAPQRLSSEARPALHAESSSQPRAYRECFYPPKVVLPAVQSRRPSREPEPEVQSVTPPHPYPPSSPQHRRGARAPLSRGTSPPPTVARDKEVQVTPPARGRQTHAGSTSTSLPPTGVTTPVPARDVHHTAGTTRLEELAAEDTCQRGIHLEGTPTPTPTSPARDLSPEIIALVPLPPLSFETLDLQAASLPWSATGPSPRPHVPLLECAHDAHPPLVRFNSSDMAKPLSQQQPSHSPDEQPDEGGLASAPPEDHLPHGSSSPSLLSSSEGPSPFHSSRSSSLPLPLPESAATWSAMLFLDVPNPKEYIQDAHFDEAFWKLRCLLRCPDDFNNYFNY